MPQDLANQLVEQVNRETPHLREFPEAATTRRPKGEESWSPREELGHLLDSAVNNHIRIVKGSLEGSYAGPGYAQDDWVRIHDYQSMPWPDMVETWRLHNLLLARAVERVPEERLVAHCAIGNYPEASLKFVIVDYMLHMQHHLDHLLHREHVTPYPAATPPE